MINAHIEDGLALTKFILKIIWVSIQILILEFF